MMEVETKQTLLITLPILGPTEATLESTGPNPYADGEEKIDTYRTADGHEAWYEAGTMRLVQYGPGPDADVTKKGDGLRRDVPWLRDVAQRIAAHALSRVNLTVADVHPLEDRNEKKGVFFFRWDDFGKSANDAGLPPFVQVALYADGTLASYTDTLR